MAEIAVLKKKGGRMISGVMTTRHIVLHPQALIGSIGIRGYMALLCKCLSYRRYFLINLMMDSRINGKVDCRKGNHNVH